MKKNVGALLKKILILINFLIILIKASSTYAQPITQVQLYYRCHAHLTDMRPLANDNLLAQVRSGQKTAQQACIDLLNSGLMNGSGELNNSSSGNTVSKAILTTMQRLHSSWLSGKDLNAASSGESWVTEVYDYNSVSMHLTRALLDNNYQFKNIVTDNSTMDIRRETSTTGGSDNTNEAIEGVPYRFFTDTISVSDCNQSSLPYVSGGPNDNTSYQQTIAQIASSPWKNFERINNEWIITDCFDSPMVEKGPLLGWKNPRQVTINTTEHGTINVHENLYGAGAISHPAYLYGNTETHGTVNGGLRTFRRWSSRVIKDFLCRDLPVLDYSHALGSVEPNSELAYRRDVSCMVCHKTMDEQAYMIRNLTKPRVGGYQSSLYVPSFRVPRTHEISRSAEIPLGSNTPDGSFYRRPPRGAFNYVDMDGNYISQQFNNLDEFGDYLAEFDDLYSCFAGRYLEYFTGIKPYLGNIQNFNLNNKELEHRNFARQLGQALKSSQDPRSVIELIFNSPYYRDRNYGGAFQ
jgi:hypothetical protein